MVKFLCCWKNSKKEEVRLPTYHEPPLIINNELLSEQVDNRHRGMEMDRPQIEIQRLQSHIIEGSVNPLSVRNINVMEDVPKISDKPASIDLVVTGIDNQTGKRENDESITKDIMGGVGSQVRAILENLAIAEEFQKNINSSGEKEEGIRLYGSNYTGKIINNPFHSFNSSLGGDASVIRRRYAKKKISTLKGVISEEIISDIIYQRNEDTIRNEARMKMSQHYSKNLKVSNIVFLFQGKKVIKYLFQCLSFTERLNFLLATRDKIKSNPDSQLLFLCIIKTAINFNIEKIHAKVEWPQTLEGNIVDRIQYCLKGQDDLIRFWCLFIHFESSKLDLQAKYNICRSKPYDKPQEIEKDITRTFNETLKTAKCINLLRDILTALGNSTEIAYVQGLNSVVGSIIIYFMNTLKVSPETHSESIGILIYSVLKFMLDRRAITIIYTEEFYGFHYISACTQLWIKVLHPDLYEILVDIRKLRITTVLTTSVCCIDGYLRSFPLSILLRLL